LVVKQLKNYIRGRWCNASGTNPGQCVNPADSEIVLAETPDSQPADAEAALAAASEAFGEWSRVPMPKRAELLSDFVRRLRNQEEEFVSAITAENGKTLRESRGEFQSAIKEAEYQISQNRRYGGAVKPSEVPGVTCYLLRQPLGVVTLITPWNFPLNVACRKMVPALLAGNCCVLKPSELTPLSAVMLFSLLDQSNVPPGVANLVIGRGSIIGDTLTTHEAVRGISFTGSTVVGRGIAEIVGGRDTSLQLEMGGKNPLVVLADADVDAAVNAAIVGGFSCSGQWCTSTSRTIVDSSLHNEFLEKLSMAAEKLIVGNGASEGVQMGPVCGRKQYDSVLRYLDTGVREGARLCIGGKALTEGSYARGFFVAPTVFADVTPDMTIAREEIFGPVISVIKAIDFEDSIRLANDTCYGLASSIYTNDVARANQFIHESEVGLCHVNMPTAHKEPQLDFGGIKESGRGLPEAGDAGIEFFTRHKAVYIKGRP
jgi:aldehyde dehydrogenase (NAD+)